MTELIVKVVMTADATVIKAADIEKATKTEEAD